MKDTNIFDVIIMLTKAIKSTPKTKNKNINYFYSSFDNYKFGNLKYILNQLLRQYDIPQDHVFISEEASNHWNSITNDDITKFNYNDKFTLKTPLNEIYKGANKSPQTLDKPIAAGRKIEFRKVFHEEHIIPIDNIIKMFIALDENDLTYDNVKKILDNIYICKMLKSENANLSHKRPNNVIEIVDTIYKDIKIVNWENIKRQLDN